jgi:hypothetical protein
VLVYVQVSFDAAKLFFVDHVKETRDKLSHLARGGSDTHGFLTTTQQDVIFRFGNNSVIDRTIRPVGLEMLQIDWVVELGGKVGRTGNEQRLFAIKAQTIDLLFVRLNFILDIAIVRIVQTNHAIVKANQDIIVQCRPMDGRCVDLFAVNLGQINFQPRLFRVRQGLVLGNIIDANLAVVFDKGIRNGRESVRSFRPGDAADGSLVGKGLQTLAGFYLPQFDRCVGRGGQ